jgi:2-oxoglutarate dehydrogenase complex dehydrogenase (E1) component-like enzyme
MIWNLSNRMAFCQILKKLKQKYILKFDKNQPMPKKEVEKGTENIENSCGIKLCPEMSSNQGSFRYLSFQFTKNLSKNATIRKKNNCYEYNFFSGAHHKNK